MYYLHKFQASEGYISWQKAPTAKRVINFLSDGILTWHWVATQSDLNNHRLGIPYCRALKIRGMNPYYYIYIYIYDWAWSD